MTRQGKIPTKGLRQTIGRTYDLKTGRVDAGHAFAVQDDAPDAVDGLAETGLQCGGVALLEIALQRENRERAAFFDRELNNGQVLIRMGLHRRKYQAWCSGRQSVQTRSPYTAFSTDSSWQESVCSMRFCAGDGGSVRTGRRGGLGVERCGWNE